MRFPYRYLFPEKASGFFYLFLIWLFTGFATGTIVLLWPLRIWVNYTRDHAKGDTIEKAGIVVIILLLVLTSLRISLQLFQWHVNQEKRSVTVYALLVPFFCSGGALWLLMNPQMVNKGTAQTTVTEQFTTGPYPTAAKIHQLKLQGFTGIITLLHPAVVPFEPELITEERDAAKKEQVKLIEAPMLPWLADNTTSLKKIEALAKDTTGKYYVHCYLGKDRVNVVKNMLLRLSGNAAVNKTEGEGNRTFESVGSLERGNIFRLDKGIYMTPFPTDEEFLSFFLAGNIKSVVSILDTTVADNRPWLKKEYDVLHANEIGFYQYNVKTTMSEKSIQHILAIVDTLPRPLVIHQWNVTSPESKFLLYHSYLKSSVMPVNLATHEPAKFEQER